MKNPAVDAYIKNSPAFARPILTKLRKLIHQACPEITETLKWSAPFFEHQGVVAGFSAHKQHVNFILWKGKLLQDSAKLLTKSDAMPNGSVLRWTAVEDLPPDKILLAYLAEAVALNEQGVKLPARKKTPKKPLATPPELMSALRGNKVARLGFESLSPSHQREYVAWITEAKQEATRERRLAKMLEQVAAGKSLNWKYERKK